MAVFNNNYAGDRIDYYGQADKQKKKRYKERLLINEVAIFSRETERESKLPGDSAPFFAFYFNYGFVTQTVISFKSLDNNLQEVLVSEVL